MKKLNLILIELWIVLVIVITKGVSKLQPVRPIFVLNNTINDSNKVTSHLITGNQLTCTEALSVDFSKIWSSIQVKVICLENVLYNF
jgi:hypothetical protein